MAKVMKTCRVCGKQYEACHTPNPGGVFRWRDVACSLECAREYFDSIDKSRSTKPKEEESDSDASAEK